MAWRRDGSGATRLVPLDDILILFVASALDAGVRKPAVIDAPWARRASFSGRRVYVRTTTEVLRTQWKNLEDAGAHLSALGLLLRSAHYGAVVNLNALSEIELDTRYKTKRVGFRLTRDQNANPLRDHCGRPASIIEWVLVSGRNARGIITALTTLTC